MQCQTVRPGTECFFWKKKGCTHKDGICLEIVEKCKGCGNIIIFQEKEYCRVYPDPASKWLNDKDCTTATHIQVEEQKTEEKKINPLKASKRAGGRR